MFAYLAEKTGWTLKQISELSLGQLRLIMQGWEDISKPKEKNVPSTIEDVRKMERLFKDIK